MVPAACPACGTPVGAPGARFCEACGHELSAPAPAQKVTVDDGETGRWLTSAGPPSACLNCGGTSFDDDYCQSCGQRRSAGLDHREIDLGALAGVTDRGLRHHRNEDAMGLAVAPGVVLGMVCDGVSSSTRPDTASHAAVEAATPVLLDEVTDGVGFKQAITTAARAAQAAATLAAGTDPGTNPPACTFVCAVVAEGNVTVGWVGDSRAYWLPEAGEPACLTEDDSMAGKMRAEGVNPAEIPTGGAATALMRWLGADATDTDPRLAMFTPTGPGRVLVCSDGVFRYWPAAADLAATTPAKAPLDTAAELVRLALGQGGHDNITAVVLPYPPDPAGALLSMSEPTIRNPRS
jgi:serine/threonine protein phosphatase PrpC